jgi:cell division protein FtsQ
MWQDIRFMNALTNMLLGMCALMLLGAGCWWVAQQPMFTLKEIRIEGGEARLRHVDPLMVRTIAVPRIRGNFFTADLDAVRQAFEAMPWVRTASVRREWPNRLTVTLDEHMPLGTWGDAGRLLSVRGAVFTANLAEAEEDAVLAGFSGPAGSEREVAVRFQELRAWFAPLNLTPRELHLSRRYGWTVKLDNGMTLDLGREQNKTLLKQRIDRFVRVYPQLAMHLQDRIESVDLRYPNGLALSASGLALGVDGKRGIKKSK